MKSNKKGFTLIEIIVCISLIVVISVSSFFGIRLVTKNIKTTKLEQITERVLRAAEAYIETNKETKSQLYNNKSSVVIPLNTLLNEGLMDLKGTTLEDKDIENEYVVAAFTRDSTEEDCIDITESTSWNLSKDNPFYICTNESGSQNSIIIGGTTSNIDTVKVQTDYVTNKNGVYTFNGGDNYIIKKGEENKKYRIILVDRDDSLVIGTTESSFNGAFDGKTQKYASWDKNHNQINSIDYVKNVLGETTGLSYIKDFFTNNNCTNRLTEKTSLPIIENTIYQRTIDYDYPNAKYLHNLFVFHADYNMKNGEVSLSFNDMKAMGLTIDDFAKTTLTSTTNTPEKIYEGILYYKNDYNRCAYDTIMYSAKKHTYNYTVHELGTIETAKKVKLKSCMKITAGTGSEVNPYEISDLC